MALYHWDFGDGTTSTEVSPTHVYRPGTYTVTLRITDDFGNVSSETKVWYIYVDRWGTTYNVATTNKSFRFGINTRQGYGYSENSGSFPFPEARVGTVSILDANQQPRSLVIDAKDGLMYDIGGRDSYAGSNILKVWKDKADSGGVGGTDIAPSILFREDRASSESFRIEHLASRFYLRPVKESNRDASGYDSSGFLDDISFDMTIYVDGEPVSPTAVASGIDKRGDLVYERRVEGHRIQSKLSADKSSFRVTGRRQDYKVKDIPQNPDDRIMSEGDRQNEFGTPTLWLTRGEGYAFNRADGSGVTTNIT